MKKFFVKVSAILVSIASIFVIAAPAAHAGMPIVWNSRGGSIPMYYAPTNATYVKSWLPNSSKFYMICYTDSQWYTGNYRTNRWFCGQSYATGQYGYVNASWVYYQWNVRRC
jgi:hypothetical protein